MNIKQRIHNTFTVKQKRAIIKQFNIQVGTSNMKKMELVDYIVWNINMDISHDDLLARAFEIPEIMILKLKVFTILKSSTKRKKAMKKYFNMKETNKMTEVFNVWSSHISQLRIEKSIEEMGLGIDTSINNNSLSNLIEKESNKWDVNINFTITPHVKKLDQHNKIYEVVKTCEDFKDGDEMFLYHGCDKNTMDSILEQGNFSLLMSGVKHGLKYGPGVYLTDKLWKAIQYSEAFKHTKHCKYVLVCKVLIKNKVLARSHQVLFEKDAQCKEYDTGVDNLDNPIEYIKKDTNHICIMGTMEIVLDRRDCKILNRAYGKFVSNNQLGITCVVGLQFINKYDPNKAISIIWINNASGKIQIMTPRLESGNSTTIKTMIGHVFEIHIINHANNQTEKKIKIKIIRNMIDTRSVVLC
jgi:hypothetical protein